MSARVHALNSVSLMAAIQFSACVLSEGNAFSAAIFEGQPAIQSTNQVGSSAEAFVLTSWSVDIGNQANVATRLASVATHKKQYGQYDQHLELIKHLFPENGHITIAAWNEDGLLGNEVARRMKTVQPSLPGKRFVLTYQPKDKNGGTIRALIGETDDLFDQFGKDRKYEDQIGLYETYVSPNRIPNWKKIDTFILNYGEGEIHPMYHLARYMGEINLAAWHTRPSEETGYLIRNSTTKGKEEIQIIRPRDNGQIGPLRSEQRTSQLSILQSASPDRPGIRNILTTTSSVARGSELDPLLTKESHQWVKEQLSKVLSQENSQQ